MDPIRISIDTSDLRHSAMEDTSSPPPRSKEEDVTARHYFIPFYKRHEAIRSFRWSSKETGRENPTWLCPSVVRSVLQAYTRPRADLELEADASTARQLTEHRAEPGRQADIAGISPFFNARGSRLRTESPQRVLFPGSDRELEQAAAAAEEQRQERICRDLEDRLRASLRGGEGVCQKNIGEKARKIFAILSLMNGDNSIIEELVKDEKASHDARSITEKQQGGLLPLQYAAGNSCGSRARVSLVAVGIAVLGAALSTTGDIYREDFLTTSMNWDIVNPPFRFKNPALVSAALHHPLWVVAGVVLNTLGLATYYQIKPGKRYRDPLLIASVGSAAGLGILALNLDMVSVLLRIAPWVSIIALILGSAHSVHVPCSTFAAVHSVRQDNGDAEIADRMKM